MREIKFRGKSDGKWVYGSYVKTDTGLHYIIPQNVLANVVPRYVVNKETVGQFTGLFDKYGKEIYEGDIILWELNKEEKTAPVYYNTVEAIFWMGKEKIGDSRFVCNDWMLGLYEVIGNIYEKQELLK